MDAPVEQPEEESIAGLLGRLVEDGRSFAEAELKVVQAIARHRAARAQRALVFLLVGAVLVVLAVLALLFGLVLSLAALIGPLWAGLAIGVPLAAGGYFLIMSGVKGMKTLGRDQAESEALERGEQS